MARLLEARAGLVTEVPPRGGAAAAAQPPAYQWEVQKTRARAKIVEETRLNVEAFFLHLCIHPCRIKCAHSC